MEQNQEPRQTHIYIVNWQVRKKSRILKEKRIVYSINAARKSGYSHAKDGLRLLLYIIYKLKNG